MVSSAQHREVSPIPDGEFAFTWSDFRKIAALVHAEAGIVLGDNKVNLVYSRLAKRLRTIGLRSFRDYCRLIESEAGVDERQAMIAAMTTNVTRFFREPHHFDHLKQSVLSQLAEEARRGSRVRLWSAGCSSGEEPYSIAISLLDAMPDAPDHDIRILATDIDPDMLRRAQGAIYRASQVENIPAESRSRWLLPTKGAGEIVFCIADGARELVRFRELNLLDAWPMTGRFDVIFCRNVMIYFDESTQNDIWLRFAEVLQPGGHLYIGHSERIATDSLPFDLVAQTTYRLRRGARR